MDVFDINFDFYAKHSKYRKPRFDNVRFSRILRQELEKDGWKNFGYNVNVGDIEMYHMGAIKHYKPLVDCHFLYKHHKGFLNEELVKLYGKTGKAVGRLIGRERYQYVVYCIAADGIQGGIQRTMNIIKGWLGYKEQGFHLLFRKRKGEWYEPIGYKGMMFFVDLMTHRATGSSGFLRSFSTMAYPYRSILEEM